MKMRQPTALMVLFCTALLFAHQADAQFVQQGPKLVGAGAAGNFENFQGRCVSLSADGNTAIVGGAKNENSDGAAWAWTRSNGVWTQQAKLSDTGGFSASLSADGNTAIIGGLTAVIQGGAVLPGAPWVWTRTGGVWTRQVKLVGLGAIGNAQQGYSVSLAADGNTAIVGGLSDNGSVGATWAWTRSGGVWTQQGTKLVGSGAMDAARQGTAVSLSADGNTAIVGGLGDNSNAGAAWIWSRSGGVWSQQGTKLVGSGAVGNAQQGSSVSLSADGNTAIVGGFADNSNIGAAWVWARGGGVWTQQSAKLVGSGGVGNFVNQGASVFLSADANTAIIGGPNDNDGLGATWIWTRSGGAWSQQGSKLVGSGAVQTYGNQQGTSVALSADGNTAIVGGPNDSFHGGAAWVWTRSGGVWTQQGTKLVGLNAVGIARQGNSVALSADGNTAIVGGLFDNNGIGAAWIWTRSGGVWTQQGAKLVGSGAVSALFAVQQGYSVSLAADGNTAIVGGPSDNGSVGAAWVWTRSGGVWTQQGTKLVGSGAVDPAAQGAAVSLSADGNTAIVGGPGDNSYAGAAWIWTRSGAVWSQQGTKLVGSGAVGTIQGPQGESVSLSADGNTAIVGGSSDNNGAGAVWIWARSGSVWTQNGTKLVGSGAGDIARQGAAVSLSADGNTAIVGGWQDGDSISRLGAAWVWTRNGGAWTQQGAKLVGLGVVGFPAYQGYSVSLSADGNTAIIGGPEYNYDAGATWLWTRSGAMWTQQGSKLVGSGVVGNAAQGGSVALSADGRTFIVGGAYDGGEVGAAWVFVSEPQRRRAVPH